MENLSFKVSSGLKNIIGRELITDKIIAIFELVKNSYDAGASRVDIIFSNIYDENASIIIADDGCGMNKQDLIDKWLFVAYSEKKEIRKTTYTDNFKKKRTYAGAKGVGRFSCDRLGHSLELFSKKEYENKTNLLFVNWDDFEKDSQEEFINIAVQYQETTESPINGLNGTYLSINNLREKWERQDILNLKKSLIKLIAPYESKDDVFEIYLHCEDEKKTDEQQNNERDKINGKINNYIFETLNIKTTQISVTVSEDGKTITTQMYDRGVYLFKLIQKSKFASLKNIMIELFYLNRAAKYNFSQIMGLQPVQFGSIFVYKNGFRIMPYGEPGSDVFDIDRRKAQGYNRYLGTRDLMGRVVILGDNPDFIETSSRDGGFIRTPAFDELFSFYMNFVHSPLEKYVVNLIRWGDADKFGGDAVTPKDIKEDIIKYITNYEKNGQVVSIDINEEFFDIIGSNKKNGTAISEIRNIAQKYNNKELDKLIDKVEKQSYSLMLERQELSKQIDEKSEKLKKAEKELETTKRQAFFLKGLTNPKYENATESLHMMNTYAKSIKLNMNKIVQKIENSSDELLANKVKNNIYEILKAIQKINTTYTFAFSADYDIRKSLQVVNIYTFINEYINNALFSKTGEFINIHIQAISQEEEVCINPLEFSMIIENIIYNSYKANAKNLNININRDMGFTVIEFRDDGVGLSDKIENPQRIFELGFTTTGGTGVGLAYAKKTIEKWNGSINILEDLTEGFSLIVRLKNEH